MRKGKEEVSSENQPFSVHELPGGSGIDRVACVERAAKKSGSYVNVEAATSWAANDAGDPGVSSRKHGAIWRDRLLSLHSQLRKQPLLRGNPLLLRRWIWLPVL